MSLLVLLLLPIAELIVLFRVGGAIGVVNTLFALIAAGILGAGLARTQGKFVIRRLQGSLARGEMPGNEVVHGLLIFVGGVLFLIPGFVSDVIGFFLILPGTRHLMVYVLKKKIARGLSQGQFRVFKTGGGFAGGFGGAFGGFGGASGSRPRGPFGASGEDPSFSRDVTPKVIDVTPIASEVTSKTDGNDSDPKPH